MSANAQAAGLSVELVSIAELEDRFVATLRFTNADAAPRLIAIRGSNAFQGEFSLSDGMGGSCPLRRGGAGSLGTLANALPASVIDPRFSPVPAQGSVTHTLFFHKDWCETPASSKYPLTLRETFVLVAGESKTAATASFDAVAAIARR